MFLQNLHSKIITKTPNYLKFYLKKPNTIRVSTQKNAALLVGIQRFAVGWAATHHSNLSFNQTLGNMDKIVGILTATDANDAGAVSTRVVGVVVFSDHQITTGAYFVQISHVSVGIKWTRIPL